MVICVDMYIYIVCVYGYVYLCIMYMYDINMNNYVFYLLD